jgi:hypothetical protein
MVYQLTKEKQYNEKELIKMIENLEVTQMNVLITQQNLSIEFCRNYILNEEYSITDEDSYIDIYDVIKYQQHIKLSDFTPLEI